jgi:uncharacterized protein YecE (DUF72 family)
MRVWALRDLSKNHQTVYCMFNNDNMFANAADLISRLGE